ncbi:MAG TPA: hypothetical protein VKX16_03955 [Chloroflexota bacterium]|nr:hypothetical protein [Chloroflexota bacterium]
MRIGICAAALAASVVAMGISPALAAKHPSLHVSPAKVTVGHKARLTATNVHPNSYFPVLIAVPDAKQRNKTELFAGIVRSNKGGSINTMVKIPVFPRCGGATLYIFNGRFQSPISTRLTLTGCKGSSAPAPPPPPAR